MKSTYSLIILFLLMFSGEIARSQVLKTDNPWLQRDKLVHFTYSAGFTPALIQMLEIKGVKHPEILGAGLLFGAGLAKEFLIDSKPAFEDIAINLAGCVAGIYLNRLIVKTYKKNHAKKQILPLPGTPPQ